MRVPPARRALVLVGLAALAAAWPLGAWSSASTGDENAREAAQLVARMRRAPAQHDFTGRVQVRWHDGATTRQAVVSVDDAQGTLEVVDGDRTVLDRGHDTYLKDAAGWMGVLVTPVPRGLPAPGATWHLSLQAGPKVAGRATTVVEATRASGQVAQRVYVDAQTSLLLGQDVLGPGGQVERSLRFLEISVGPTPSLAAPAGVHEPTAGLLRTVPDQFAAPTRTGSGFTLVTRAAHGSGIVLFYSDGMFSMTVGEQQGDLDWGSLAKGGTTTSVGGDRARSYREPGSNVFVWEHDGVVFTCVSDAPSDVFRGAVAGLTGSGRSTVQSVADFVLGPFGWR